MPCKKHKSYMHKKILSLIKKNWPTIILVCIVLFAISIRVYYFFGIERTDSLKYSQAAFNLLHGTFFTDSQWFGMTRIVLIFPLALFYKIFGVNDTSSAMWILSSNIIGIILIYFIGKFINIWVGLIAAFLVAIYSLEVAYATSVLPDGLCLLFITLPILLFLLSEKRNVSSRTRLLLYLASGVVWGLSYYIKINMVIIFPIFLLVYSIAYKKLNVKYLWILVGFIATCSAVCILFHIKTGHFFLQEEHHYLIYKYGLPAVNFGKEITIDYSKVVSSESSNIYGLFYVFIKNIKIFFKLVWIDPTLRIPIFAGIVSTLLLIISRYRNKYKIVFVIVISAWLSELLAKFSGWGVGDERYLVSLTLSTVIPIAALLYEMYVSRILFVRIAVIMILLYGLYSSRTDIVRSYKHHNRLAGNFFIASNLVSRIGKDYKGIIIVSPDPFHRLRRSINYYMQFNTGYNYFNPDTYSTTSNLLDYQSAGANYNPTTKQYQFDTNDPRIKKSIIVRFNTDNLLDSNNLQEIWRYKYWLTDMSLLKVKPD